MHTFDAWPGVTLRHELRAQSGRVYLKQLTRDNLRGCYGVSRSHYHHNYWCCCFWHMQDYYYYYYYYYYYLFIYLFFSGNDQEEEIKHDIDNALPKVDEWKSQILRAAHQHAAKSDIVNNLPPSQVLLIMDWAMKFLSASLRETQRDWFGKKGKSWHVTVEVTKSDSHDIEVTT